MALLPTAPIILVPKTQNCDTDPVSNGPLVASNERRPFTLRLRITVIVAMLDPPSIIDNEEKCFYDLVVASSGKYNILKTMTERLWRTTRLLAKEKVLFINKRHVD